MGQLSIGACETFGPEIDAAIETHRAYNIRRVPLPCHCWRGALRREHLPREAFDDDGSELHIFGTGSLNCLGCDALQRTGVHLHVLGLCHELIAPRSTLDTLISRGAYLVTTTWLRSWEHRLQLMGIVDSQTRAMFAEACRVVVLLDTGVCPLPLEQLTAFANAVSLPFEIVDVGNDVLEQRIELLALKRELRVSRVAASDSVARAMQLVADHAMALEVFTELAGVGSESEVVEGMFRLFDALMAPGTIAYAPVIDGMVGAWICRSSEPTSRVAPSIMSAAYELTESGFSVAIPSSDSLVGVLSIENLAHPEHRDRYIGFALNVVAVCALAISKARQTERLTAAERALSSEKERLATTLRSIGDGVLATDSQGRVVLMNEVAESLTCRRQSDASGTPWHQVMRVFYEKTGEPETDLVDRVVSTGQHVSLLNGARLLQPEGSWREIAQSAAPIRDVEGTVIGVVIVFRDVTDTLHLERELQRIERLESLGVFAGGLAHDFNNLLAAVLTNVSFAKEDLDPSSEGAECLSDAILAVERARGLTRQLLTFAKGGMPTKTTLSMGALLRQSAGLPLRGTKTRIDFDIDPGLALVNADPTQLGQVFHNLAINASQAMPNGGTLRISARNADPADCAMLPGKPAHGVSIEIVDQGPGISAENLARIFDPFFTTKKTGSGLGLAVVHSIITRHNGWIEAFSELGKGATFRILLPASDHGVAVAPIPSPLIAGSGNILLMDDEAAVRKSTERALSRLGYTVVSVADGQEAIREYSASLEGAHRFNLVILDLTVPGGKGGVETLHGLLSLDPYVRALAYTGYTNASVMSDAASYGFVGAISKPFDLHEFSRLVDDLIRHESLLPPAYEPPQDPKKN